MTTTVFLVMLASAGLHATWNAWVKSRRDPYGAMIAIGVGAGWPCAVLLAWTGLPETVPWGFIATTVALSVPAQALLGAAYREGDFVVAYPIVRGVNPVVIAIASAALFGERLGWPAALGVGCVSAGIVLLGVAAARRSRSVSLQGLSFAALSAFITAFAVLADSAGARAANDAVAYGSLITILNSGAMAAYHGRRLDLSKILRENWPITLVAPLVSTASYLLMIWSFGHAPVALVIALRETSMLFAVAIGVGVLRERIGLGHAIAVGIVFGGVLLIRSSS